MPNKISLTLLLTVAVAIVALCAPAGVMAQDTYTCQDLDCTGETGPDYILADYSAFRCNDQELKFISMEVIQCAENSPLCPCVSNPTKICTVANYEITSYGHQASHVNFSVPPEFVPTGCTGCTSTEIIPGPDPSTGDCSGIYSGYLWLLKVNLDDSWINGTLAFSVAVAGQYDKGPRNAFVRSTADSSLWAYGPSLSFYPFSRAEVVNSTKDEFTVKDPVTGETYLIEVFKYANGNISQVKKNGLDITDQGIPWDQVKIKGDPNKGFEKVKHVSHGAVTKSGEQSTCAYWYRGVYYDFCN